MNENKRDGLLCSFCGRSQYDVQKLVAGPSAFICDRCILERGYVDESEPKKVAETEIEDPQSCVFCGKSRNEVINLLKGPSASICNECVELCTNIINE